jgi:hypothetical protein
VDLGFDETRRVMLNTPSLMVLDVTCSTLAAFAFVRGSGAAATRGLGVAPAVVVAAATTPTDIAPATARVVTEWIFFMVAPLVGVRRQAL